MIVAVTVAAWFMTADVRVADGVGSIGMAAVVRWIGGHVSFSFGQGFVGYRADLGWPRGVQEDDDVRWNWRGSTAVDKAARGR